jgi:hypothetical protein
MYEDKDLYQTGYDEKCGREEPQMRAYSDAHWFSSVLGLCVNKRQEVSDLNQKQVVMARPAKWILRGLHRASFSEKAL